MATSFLYPPSVTPPCYVERTFEPIAASSSQGRSLRQECQQKVQSILLKILQESLERTEKAVMVTGVAHRIKLASSAYEKEHLAKQREMNVVRALVEKIVNFDPFKEFDHLAFSKAMDVAQQRSTFSKDLLKYARACQCVILENYRDAGEYLEAVEQKLDSHMLLSPCLNIANTPSLYYELEEKVSTFLVECSDAENNVKLQMERFKTNAFKKEDVTCLWIFNRSLCEQFLARIDIIDLRIKKNELKQLAGNEYVALEGNAIAQYFLGCCYHKGIGVEKNEAEGVRYFRMSVEQGNAYAQNNLGACYQKGFGIEKNELEAIRYYRMSAEQGNSEAQCNLGYCYRNGIGVEKNDAEGVRYYKMSAEQGNIDAQNNLGCCYEKGIEVEKNEEEAIRYYRMSAEQGSSTAQNNLGRCYRNGIGVVQNKAEAMRYFCMSAEQGNIKAKNELNRMLKIV